MNNKHIIESVYDTAANVSYISKELAKEHRLNCWKFKRENLSAFTINNSIECLGRVTVNIQIGEISKQVILYVIDNSNYSLILGLDLIKIFKLNCSNDLRIFQMLKLDNKFVQKEIVSNYTKLTDKNVKIQNESNQSKNAYQINKNLKETISTQNSLCKNTNKKTCKTNQNQLNDQKKIQNNQSFQNEKFSKENHSKSYAFNKKVYNLDSKFKTSKSIDNIQNRDKITINTTKQINIAIKIFNDKSNENNNRMIKLNDKFIHPK